MLLFDHPYVYVRPIPVLVKQRQLRRPLSTSEADTSPSDSSPSAEGSTLPCIGAAAALERLDQQRAAYGIGPLVARSFLSLAVQGEASSLPHPEPSADGELSDGESSASEVDSECSMGSSGGDAGTDGGKDHGTRARYEELQSRWAMASSVVQVGVLSGADHLRTHLTLWSLQDAAASTKVASLQQKPAEGGRPEAAAPATKLPIAKARPAKRPKKPPAKRPEKTMAAAKSISASAQRLSVATAADSSDEDAAPATKPPIAKAPPAKRPEKITAAAKSISTSAQGLSVASPSEDDEPFPTTSDSPSASSDDEAPAAEAAVEASSAAAPAPAPASAKTTLPPTTVRTVECPTKAGVIFTDATESDAAVQELASSRFLMKEQRMLPYRTGDGHISLPLLESSMALVTSGALTPPKQVVSSLHKWLRYARHTLGGGNKVHPHPLPRPQIYQEEDSVTCPICLDPFPPSEIVQHLPCKHEQCQSCTHKLLLERTDHPNCPLCRTAVQSCKITDEGLIRHIPIFFPNMGMWSVQYAENLPSFSEIARGEVCAFCLAADGRRVVECDTCNCAFHPECQSSIRLLDDQAINDLDSWSCSSCQPLAPQAKMPSLLTLTCPGKGGCSCGERLMFMARQPLSDSTLWRCNGTACRLAVEKSGTCEISPDEPRYSCTARGESCDVDLCLGCARLLATALAPNSDDRGDDGGPSGNGNGKGSEGGGGGGEGGGGSDGGGEVDQHPSFLGRGGGGDGGVVDAAPSLADLYDEAATAALDMHEENDDNYWCLLERLSIAMATTKVQGKASEKEGSSRTLEETLEEALEAVSCWA